MPLDSEFSECTVEMKIINYKKVDYSKTCVMPHGAIPNLKVYHFTITMTRVLSTRGHLHVEVHYIKSCARGSLSQWRCWWLLSALVRSHIISLCIWYVFDMYADSGLQIYNGTPPWALGPLQNKYPPLPPPQLPGNPLPNMARSSA